MDLKSEEGLAIIKDLVKTVDVVMENYRSGVMDRLGLGYEALKAINPGLIYASGTGWGSSGPWSSARRRTSSSRRAPA